MLAGQYLLCYILYGIDFESFHLIRNKDISLAIVLYVFNIYIYQVICFDYFLSVANTRCFHLKPSLTKYTQILPHT